MRSALLFLCLVGCPSSRSQPTDAAPSASFAAVASSAPEIATRAPTAGADAAVVLADCFEPSRVVQLGTLANATVRWDDDLVAVGAKRFDPETLAEVVAPARVHTSPPRTNDLLVTGERVEQFKSTLVAGARRLPQLEEGMAFERVENGRWIVGAFNDLATFGVVDGLARKRDPRTFLAVHGDLAAFTDPATSSVTVTNLLTRANVLVDIGECAPGGIITWSLSPRFLWCDSNRFGRTGYDLRTGKAFAVGQSAFMSPDESYFVRVPGVGWGSNLISEDRAEWTSASTGRTMTLTKDVPHPTEDTTPLTSTVPVAFCGDGKLFAIVGKKDLVVYRADGKRLAAARSMPGGWIAFSKSGRWILDARAGAATVYRLEP